VGSTWEHRLVDRATGKVNPANEERVVEKYLPLHEEERSNDSLSS